MTIEAVVTSHTISGPAVAQITAAPRSAGLIGRARSLFASASVAETLEILVDLARREFGVGGAGVLLTAPWGVASAVASGTLARRAEALQVDQHQGPGFQAIHGGQPVVSSDLRSDGRWRFWAPKAAELGLCSVLSFGLADGDPFGAVTLYSPEPSYFGTDALAPGLLFAQQASIAITVAVEREHLVRAAESRGMVGQAQGILMERYQVNADQALGMIKRASSTLNQKLRLIAERIVQGLSLAELDLLAVPHLVGGSAIGFDRDH